MGKTRCPYEQPSLGQSTGMKSAPLAKYLASFDPQTEFPDGLPFGTTATNDAPHLHGRRDIQILTDASKLYPLRFAAIQHQDRDWIGGGDGHPHFEALGLDFRFRPNRFNPSASRAPSRDENDDCHSTSTVHRALTEHRIRSYAIQPPEPDGPSVHFHMERRPLALCYGFGHFAGSSPRSASSRVAAMHIP